MSGESSFSGSLGCCFSLFLGLFGLFSFFLHCLFSFFFSFFGLLFGGFDIFQGLGFYLFGMLLLLLCELLRLFLFELCKSGIFLGLFEFFGFQLLCDS